MIDDSGEHENELPQSEGAGVAASGPPAPPPVPHPKQPNEHGQPLQPSPVPPNWQPNLSTSLAAVSREPRSKTWLIVAVVAGIFILGASLTTVLVLNHRADVAAEERRDEAARKVAAEKAAKKKAVEEARQEAEERAAAELAAARDTYSGCTQQLNPLLNTLQTVNARLDVGLTQGDLSGLVGKVSIAYNRMDVDQLGVGACLRAAVQLEKAFNSYNHTVSQWNDCIFDDYCDTDGIMPGMQGKWLRAASAIERAEHLLDSLDPDSASYAPDPSAKSA